MRRALAAATLAAGLLLAGCGGGGGDEKEEAAAAETPGAGAEAAVPGEPGAADGIPDETVPTEELTPPEGAFTREQRAYLTDRVPVGADPAAILLLGAEACERIGYLERHDPDGVVAALRDGEIPDAGAAIEHLCPEYADLWAQAQQ
ncbi:hypothetical protein [Streptomyces sp. 6N223]|uniref:hypothetical protein n=1 Tax=Streptomyces sp. 6N223 TaxID=3457412 RepID=UPI003FD0CE1A